MGWFTREKPASAPQDPLNEEYATLSREQKPRVDVAIAEVERTGRLASATHGSAEYYAFPHASGGTSLGIDDPINIKRGVKR